MKMRQQSVDEEISDLEQDMNHLAVASEVNTKNAKAYDAYHFKNKDDSLDVEIKSP